MPEVQVAAGVGRAGEADLVPRPGVGVERGAGVPGPQAPHLRGRAVVPRLAVGARGPARPGPARPARPVAAGRTPAAVPACGVLVQGARVSPPGLAVLGQVVVVPAVGLADRPGGCRSARAPAPAARCPGRAAGPAAVRRRPARRWVKKPRSFGGASRASTTPAVTSSQTSDLVQDVEAGEPAPALRGDRPLRSGCGRSSAGRSLSRRSTAASRPIPPTREASSGANIGGPASML